MRLTASGFLASAPNPYTVSVGKVTKWPAFKATAASRIVSAVQLDRNGELLIR